MKLPNNQLVKKLILIAVIFFAGILRLNNLLFDYPHFFNPDERNMVIAMTRFKLPKYRKDILLCIASEFKFITKYKVQNSNSCNLNPHFFAYGQFPLYLGFFSHIASYPLLGGENLNTDVYTISYPQAVYWLRIYSVVSSILTVLLVFLVTRKLSTLLFRTKTFLAFIIASVFTAFSPGLIQSAHFGTTESLLTFFGMLATLLSLNLLDASSEYSLKKYQKRIFPLLFTSSVFIGMAIGAKLTGLFLLSLPSMALFLNLIKRITKLPRKRLAIFVFIYNLEILIFLSLLFSILFSPYNLIEPDNFRSAVFGYEKDVATGKFPAFYTRQFIDTLPILFQLKKILPYTLGLPVFILAVMGILEGILFSLEFKVIKIKNFITKIFTSSEKSYNINLNYRQFSALFLILFFSFVYFIPNSFLYAKWTRFMTPLLPFFSIFAALFLVSFVKLLNLFFININLKYRKIIISIVLFLIIFSAVIPGLAFSSIYLKPDTREKASIWMYENIKDGSNILFETANVIDIPLSLDNVKDIPKYNMVSFDFYHIDEKDELFSSLLVNLEKADYFIIPSRRIFANHLPHPEMFPRLVKFYDQLFSGKLGFEKAAEFSSYPGFYINIDDRQFPLISFPDESAEESFTVFDHPVIRIYKKNENLPLKVYRNLLSIEDE